VILSLKLNSKQDQFVFLAPYRKNLRTNCYSDSLCCFHLNEICSSNCSFGSHYSRWFCFHRCSASLSFLNLSYSESLCSFRLDCFLKQLRKCWKYPMPLSLFCCALADLSFIINYKKKLLILLHLIFFIKFD